MRNWPEIRRRHYVRKATAGNHWFDFMPSRVRSYQSQFEDDFCLVINGSETQDDAYIIPFRDAKRVFTEPALDGRGRWIGTIVGSTLTLSPSGNSLPVATYHNAFHFLDEAATAAPAPIVSATNIVSSVIADAVETTLHLESDLEGFLLADLGQLEKGLTLFRQDGLSGHQLEAGAAGRIDILAKDAGDNLVVIEVKAGEADRQVCGQVQAYMGWVTERFPNSSQVRGIIVASVFTERLKLAAKMVPQLQLKAYAVTFRFRDG